jgi:CHRD domain
MRIFAFIAVTVTALTTILSIAPASASLVFLATLSGASQVPSNSSTATGSAKVVLESDNTTLDVNLTFSGLVGGPATASHIHCCAPDTANAGVALPFSGFPSATSGTFVNTFDLTTDLNFGSGITVASFIAGLDAGLAYINIHDATYPGGEIRGQLVAVPEPSTWFLTVLAFIGLAFAGRLYRGGETSPGRIAI